MTHLNGQETDPEFINSAIDRAQKYLALTRRPDVAASSIPDDHQLIRDLLQIVGTLWQHVDELHQHNVDLHRRIEALRSEKGTYQ